MAINIDGKINFTYDSNQKSVQKTEYDWLKPENLDRAAINVEYWKHINQLLADISAYKGKNLDRDLIKPLSDIIQWIENDFHVTKQSSPGIPSKDVITLNLKLAQLLVDTKQFKKAQEILKKIYYDRHPKKNEINQDRGKSYSYGFNFWEKSFNVGNAIWFAELIIMLKANGQDVSFLKNNATLPASATDDQKIDFYSKQLLFDYITKVKQDITGLQKFLNNDLKQNSNYQELINLQKNAEEELQKQINGFITDFENHITNKKNVIIEADKKRVNKTNKIANMSDADIAKKLEAMTVAEYGDYSKRCWRYLNGIKDPATKINVAEKMLTLTQNTQERESLRLVLALTYKELAEIKDRKDNLNKALNYLLPTPVNGERLLALFEVCQQADDYAIQLDKDSESLRKYLSKNIATVQNMIFDTTLTQEQRLRSFWICFNHYQGNDQMGDIYNNLLENEKNLFNYSDEQRLTVYCQMYHFYKDQKDGNNLANLQKVLKKLDTNLYYNNLIRKEDQKYSVNLDTNNFSHKFLKGKKLLNDLIYVALDRIPVGENSVTMYENLAKSRKLFGEDISCYATMQLAYYYHLQKDDKKALSKADQVLEFKPSTDFQKKYQQYFLNMITLKTDILFAQEKYNEIKNVFNLLGNNLQDGNQQTQLVKMYVYAILATVSPEEYPLENVDFLKNNIDGYYQDLNTLEQKERFVDVLVYLAKAWQLAKLSESNPWENGLNDIFKKDLPDTKDTIRGLNDRRVALIKIRLRLNQAWNLCQARKFSEAISEANNIKSDDPKLKEEIEKLLSVAEFGQKLQGWVAQLNEAWEKFNQKDFALAKDLLQKCSDLLPEDASKNLFYFANEKAWYNDTINSWLQLNLHLNHSLADRETYFKSILTAAPKQDYSDYLKKYQDFANFQMAAINFFEKEDRDYEQVKTFLGRLPQDYQYQNPADPQANSELQNAQLELMRICLNPNSRQKFADLLSYFKNTPSTKLKNIALNILEKEVDPKLLLSEIKDVQGLEQFPAYYRLQAYVWQDLTNLQADYTKAVASYQEILNKELATPEDIFWAKVAINRLKIQLADLENLVDLSSFSENPKLQKEVVYYQQLFVIEKAILQNDEETANKKINELLTQYQDLPKVKELQNKKIQLLNNYNLRLRLGEPVQDKFEEIKNELVEINDPELLVRYWLAIAENFSIYENYTQAKKALYEAAKQSNQIIDQKNKQDDLLAMMNAYYQLETRTAEPKNSVFVFADNVTLKLPKELSLSKLQAGLEQRKIQLQYLIRKRDYQKVLKIIKSDQNSLQDLSKDYGPHFQKVLADYQKQLVLLKAQTYASLYNNDENFYKNKVENDRQLAEIVKQDKAGLSARLFLNQVAQVTDKQITGDSNPFEYFGKEKLVKNNGNSLWNRIENFEKEIDKQIDNQQDLADVLTALQVLYFGENFRSNHTLIKTAQAIRNDLPTGNYFSAQEKSFAYLKILEIQLRRGEEIEDIYNKLLTELNLKNKNLAKLDYYDEPIVKLLELIVDNQKHFKNLNNFEEIKIKYQELGGKINHNEQVYKEINKHLASGQLKQALEITRNKLFDKVIITDQDIEFVASKVWYQLTDPYAQAIFLEWILLDNNPKNLNKFIESYDKYAIDTQPSIYARTILQTLKVKQALADIEQAAGTSKQKVQNLIKVIRDIEVIEAPYKKYQPLLIDLLDRSTDDDLEKITNFHYARKKTYAEYLYTTAQAYRLLHKLGYSGEINYQQEAQRLAKIVTKIYPDHLGAINLEKKDSRGGIGNLIFWAEAVPGKSVKNTDSSDYSVSKIKTDTNSTLWKIGISVDGLYFDLPMWWFKKLALDLDFAISLDQQQNSFWLNDSQKKITKKNQGLDWLINGAISANLFDNLNIFGPFYFKGLGFDLLGGYQTQHSYQIDPYNSVGQKINSANGYFSTKLSPGFGLDLGKINFGLAVPLSIGYSQEQVDLYQQKDKLKQTNHYLDLGLGARVDLSTPLGIYGNFGYGLNYKRNLATNPIFQAAGKVPGILQHSVAGEFGYQSNNLLPGYFRLGLNGGWGITQAGYPATAKNATTQETLLLGTSSQSTFWNVGGNLQFSNILNSGVGFLAGVNYGQQKQISETKAYSADNKYLSRNVTNENKQGWTFKLAVVLNPENWGKGGK